MLLEEGVRGRRKERCYVYVEEEGGLSIADTGTERRTFYALFKPKTVNEGDSVHDRAMLV